MTDDQLNDLAAKIADSIFKRLVAKQQEWDEQFNDQMTEVSWGPPWGQMEYKEEDALKSNQKKIEELKELLAKAINEEDYINASKINSKIIDLKAKNK
jgi:protein-arginine kinase activator protein McsA